MPKALGASCNHFYEDFNLWSEPIVIVVCMELPPPPPSTCIQHTQFIDSLNKILIETPKKRSQNGKRTL